ncbi:uncharacterized protein LOC118471765 [Amphiprion ocellaris]|uniref:uncharacterized protein LOC118471765 n=1 Tax=Amphiprion ocellaris TaxID=80972 RepID=UPI002410CA9F|nr:uncharacterized protein LOC118471765 [Amphiprion ocellaris]
MANKDAFTRYSSDYQDFVEAVRFHNAFEEARVKSLQPGQEGQALVGFGDFRFETLQSLYEAEDPKKIRFVNYLRRKAPAPGTQMENAVRYVRSRDRQRSNPAAAATTATRTSTSSTSTATRTSTSSTSTATRTSTSSTSTATRTSTSSTSTATRTSTSSTVSSSSVSVSALMQDPRAASQFAAFVSGRRSLSAVEMQAKIKKLVVSKPAFPASSRRALSSEPPEEPMDEELVQAVVDVEE